MRQYSEMKDSVMNEKSTKSMSEMQTRFETEKKETEISLLQKESLLQFAKLDEQDLKMKKQIVLLTSLAGIILLIVLFAVFTYRSVLHKKRANTDLENKNAEINLQKEIIQHKNEMITDSINYAKTLLDIRLAGEQHLVKHFKGFQMLNHSLEIVGGCGCYFYEKNKTKWLFLIDTQEVGVPGAFNALQALDVLESSISANVKVDPKHYFDSIVSRFPSNTNVSILKFGEKVETFSNYGGIKENNGVYIVASDIAMKQLQENNYFDRANSFEFLKMKNDAHDLMALKFELNVS
jgi:hypothetical protein